MKLTRVAVLLLLVSCATSTPPDTTTHNEAVFARDLEVVSLTANAASLIRDGRTEAALELLENRLASALTSARDSVRGGVTLSHEYPNLRESPNRARVYAQRAGLPEVAAVADELAQELVRP